MKGDYVTMVNLTIDYVVEGVVVIKTLIIIKEKGINVVVVTKYEPK